MKRIMMILLSIIAILYFVVLLFFYLKQESILFHPVLTEQNFTYNFPDKFEEHFYETPNKGKIHTLKFPVEESKGIILYFHGNAGNLEDWAWVYQNFTKHNYDVEIIDYRSFGKSSGKLSEANFHSDAQFIYNQIKTKYLEENIIVYGRSVGTGIATRLAAENNPKALVLETPYFNIADLARKMLPFLPVKFLLKYRFENNKYITIVKAPIYILHGTADQVVPYKSGKKLHDLVKDKAQFIHFENGTHSNLATFEKYHGFLEDVLD